MRRISHDRSRQSTNRIKPVLIAISLCTGLAAASTPDAPPPTEKQTTSPEQEMVPKHELDVVQRRLDQVTLRLVDAYRQLFLKLPEADRSAFLIELICSALPSGASENGPISERPPLPHQVRELAYDLAAAEVVSARPLGPEFVEAAALGLADPQPQIRTKAASLLAKLDAKPIMDRVRKALSAEQQPEAAVAMLSVITRHPSRDSIDVVLAQLEPEHQPVPVLVAALDATLALFNAHPIEEKEQLARIGAAIDALGSDHLTPNAVRLLARLGNLEAVRAHISSQNEQISRAAVQALMTDPDSLEAILTEASRASALFELAAEAIRHHTPTAAGYNRVAGLPAPSAEKRGEVLVRLASSLPPAELLKVASSPMELTERERLLSIIATPEELEKLAQEEYRTEDRRLLVESLVRTRLQLKNAPGALKVIESIPAEARSNTLVQDEVAALIWLNRLDEAAARSTAIGVPKGVETWFATLERIEALDHAPDALARCSELFQDSFTDEHRERFGSIAQRLASLHNIREDPADPTAPDQIAAGADPNEDRTSTETGDQATDPSTD